MSGRNSRASGTAARAQERRERDDVGGPARPVAVVRRQPVPLEVDAVDALERDLAAQLRVVGADVRRRARHDQRLVARARPLAREGRRPELHPEGRRSGVLVDQEDPVPVAVQLRERASYGSPSALGLERAGDLPDAVRHGHQRLEAERGVDLVEADLVVAGILVATHVGHLAARDLLADLLDEIELAVVLARVADVEDGALGDLVGRVQDGADGAGRVADVHVGPPELLAEDLELAIRPEVARELVHRQVEAHARGDAVDRREAQAGRSQRPELAARAGAAPSRPSARRTARPAAARPSRRSGSSGRPCARSSSTWTRIRAVSRRPAAPRR